LDFKLRWITHFVLRFRVPAKININYHKYIVLAKPKSGAPGSVCNFALRFSVYFVWPSVLSLNDLKLHKTNVVKSTCIQEKIILRLTFILSQRNRLPNNPALITASQPSLSDPIENQHLDSGQFQKNT